MPKCKQSIEIRDCSRAKIEKKKKCIRVHTYKKARSDVDHCQHATRNIIDCK